MRPRTFSYTPADDDTDGFAAGVTGAGPFTMTATTSGDSMAHLVSLSSTANLSGINMVLSGLDAEGNTQTETVAGPNNNTVNSTKYFSQLDTVTPASTLGANTMDVGWTDDVVTPAFPLDIRANPFNVSVAIDIGGTINYTLQHCFQAIQSANPSTLTWWAHDVLNGLTADAQSNYSKPVTAIRLLLNSLTAGATITLHVIQGRH